ncbi:MAG: hypothetical protein LUD27_01870 [Clostridia bacterium]|nr:hypothetical protein [Clostridia bacterium]
MSKSRSGIERMQPVNRAYMEKYAGEYARVIAYDHSKPASSGCTVFAYTAAIGKICGLDDEGFELKYDDNHSHYFYYYEIDAFDITLLPDECDWIRGDKREARAQKILEKSSADMLGLPYIEQAEYELPKGFIELTTNSGEKLAIAVNDISSVSTIATLLNAESSPNCRGLFMTRGDSMATPVQESYEEIISKIARALNKD